MQTNMNSKSGGARVAPSKGGIGRKIGKIVLRFFAAVCLFGNKACDFGTESGSKTRKPFGEISLFEFFGKSKLLFGVFRKFGFFKVFIKFSILFRGIVIARMHHANLRTQNTAHF